MKQQPKPVRSRRSKPGACEVADHAFDLQPSDSRGRVRHRAASETDLECMRKRVTNLLQLAICRYKKSTKVTEGTEVSSMIASASGALAARSRDHAPPHTVQP